MLTIVDSSKFGQFGFAITTTLLLIGAIPQQIQAAEVSQETGSESNQESTELEIKSKSVESSNAVADSVSTQDAGVTLSQSNSQEKSSQNSNTVAESVNIQQVEVTPSQAISPSVNKTTDVNRLAVNTDLQESNISHKAADLHIEMAPASSGSTLTEAQLLAAVPLDIDALCRSFPLNSRCRDYTPPNQRPEAQPPDRTEPTVVRPSNGFAITGKVSTLGLGIDVTKAISPNLNARLGISGFGAGISTTADNVKYDADLQLFNVTALADYYPSVRSAFRLSAGLGYQDNRVDARSGPIPVNFSSGGTNYNIPNAGSLSGDVTFPNSIAPYLGIGFGNPVRRKGLGFSLDLGVLFPGSLDASLQTNVNQAALNALPNDATRAAALTTIENERQKQERALKDALGGFSVYPVLSIGVSYGF